VPYLKMPSPELQSALNGELDKKIKKHLKADGFELLHATRREHRSTVICCASGLTSWRRSSEAL
jgi:hypothetical protein